MATIHISLAEAERDLYSLVAQVEGGTSFLIEDRSQPVAILQAAPSPPLTLRERIAVLRANETVVQDSGFAEDVAEVVHLHREPLDSSIWD